MELQMSNVVLIATLVLVVVGLVFAIFWFLKRAENLSDEDRLNIERSKVAWIGAAALGILILVSHKKEKSGKMKMSMKSSATTLL